MKEKANELLASSHCISHRFQLSSKKVMENRNAQMKDLFQFLQKLFNYHHNSAVVSSVYREAVKVLQITGATSVIKVNGTRWISHTFLALKNLFNIYQAHINTCNELQLADINWRTSIQQNRRPKLFTLVENSTKETLWNLRYLWLIS